METRVEPTRITLARRLAGLTKSALAKNMHVSPGTVVLWEDGLRDATSKLEKLACAVGQRPEFLCGPEVPVTEPETISFRKRYDATREIRDIAAAAVDVAAGVLTPAVRSVFGRLPEVQIPSFAGMSPEAAAETLRRHWNLSDDPLRSTVEQFEARGVRVYWVNVESASLSAFCKWVGDEPILILNTAKKDGCRSRFDACHEVAHLCLHRDTNFESGDPKEIERQADAFASAFLLPRDTFLEDAPRSFDIERFLELKRVWKVSVQAMVRRLRDLGVFTDWQYENAYRQMSAMGWRRDPEPLAGRQEGSRVHWLLCDRLERDDIAPEAFADSVFMGHEKVQEMMPAIRERQNGLRLDFLKVPDPLGIGGMNEPTLPFYD